MSILNTLMVTAEVQEREVVLPDGGKHVFHFRELPAITWRKYQARLGSQDEEVAGGAEAYLIAESLCLPDGSPAVSYDQACKLKPKAMSALFLAIVSLNGKGDRKNGSPSAGNDGSGTPSPSLSEAEQ